MTVRDILTIGHPALRTRAREVGRDELASAEVQALIDDLIDTMRAAHGAGIAATQVGVPLRVAVVEVRHNPRYPYKPPIPLTVVVNPTIEPLGDEVVSINEGCLSVPDLRGEVERHVSIRLRRLDREGHEHDEVARGLTAGNVPARARPPRRPPVRGPRHGHDHAHHVGAVRALPPRRVRGPHHRVRRPRRFVTSVG
jgi:peptide deformylase